jgi:hypothetical protein
MQEREKEFLMRREMREKFFEREKRVNNRRRLADQILCTRMKAVALTVVLGPFP